MIGLLLAPALAQQPAALRSPSTDLEPCLANEACDDWFRSLLSETMVEYGFLFQHDALVGGAIAGKGNGFVFELHVDSATLGPDNLVTENVRLFPVLPRLEFGWQVGSYTYDDPYPQYAVSVFLLPPLGSREAGAFSGGLSASAAFPLGTHLVWAGGEVDVAYGEVRGAMVGNGSKLAGIDLVTQFVTIDRPPCADEESGCIDRYRALAPTARLGLSLEPAPPVFLYGKLGAAWIESALDIAYDQSRWVVRGLQPQVSYGGGFRVGDRIQLAIGGVTAAKPASLSTDDGRWMTRIVGGFGIRLGAERYWERREALEGAP